MQERSTTDAYARLQGRAVGLARFRLLRSLDAVAIATISAKCSHRHYHRNDWIVAPREVNNDVFFIESGTVRLQLPKTAGREVVFHDFQARDFFGGVDAIRSEPRTAGVVALTDVALTRMPGWMFTDLLHTCPDICDQFLMRLAEQIQVLVNRVNELSTLDIRHRVYAELLRLSRPRSGDEHCATISPPPLHTEIAARIGARREPVTREMKALERVGILKRSRGAVEIIDTQRLHHLLNDGQQS